MTKTLRIAAAVLAMVAWGTVAQAAGPLEFVKSLPLCANPLLQPPCTVTRAHDLVLSDDGTLAYVGTDLGLTIVDISQPTAPVRKGSVKVGGKVLGIAVKGSYAYLASVGADLKVVNVSNPNAPVVVASRAIVGYAWDVAVKDNVVYVASFSGELYLFDIPTDPAAPIAPSPSKVIGLPAWTTSNNPLYLAKLSSYVTAGNAKVSGVSVTGDNLFAVDYNYGRLYYYDVTVAANPVFKGTDYAKFTFRVEGDPAGNTAYMLATFGSSSNIFSVPIADLIADLHSGTATVQTTCFGCGSYPITATDFGGLTVSYNSNYVVYIAGKRGVVEVLDVSNPAAMVLAGSVSIPVHGIKTGESMGVQSRCDYIFTGAGILGLQVFTYPGLKAGDPRC